MKKQNLLLLLGVIVLGLIPLFTVKPAHEGDEIFGGADGQAEGVITEIRPDYTFDVTCQGSVPESLTCFLEASDFESAVRKAVSLGGDADTQACIAGAVAGALWGVPEHIWKRVRSTLHASMLRILDAFEERFGKE